MSKALISCSFRSMNVNFVITVRTHRQRGVDHCAGSYDGIMSTSSSFPSTIVRGPGATCVTGASAAGTVGGHGLAETEQQA